MIIYLIKQNIVVFVSFLRGKSLITSVWTRSMLLDFKKSTYSIRLKKTEIKTLEQVFANRSSIKF